MSKYGAKPTVIDGIRFDSQKEARRYQELRLLEQAGEIAGLRLQPEYDLKVWCQAECLEHTKIGIYRGDFTYFDRRNQAHVIEDVKGFKTPLYRWKKKHVEAQYGVTIRET